MHVLCGFALLIWVGSSHANFFEEVGEVCFKFWEHLDKNGTDNTTLPTVDKYSFAKFFMRYDDKDDEPTSVFILESEFLRGQNNWPNDMAIGEEASLSYFRLLDIQRWYEDDPELDVEAITREDIDLIIEYADYNFDGKLNEYEFTAMLDLLRPVPYGVLFQRFAVKSSEPYSDYLDVFAWFAIFVHIDTDGDRRLTQDEVSEYWVYGNYGNTFTGLRVHSAWDRDGDGDVTIEEWEQNGVDLDIDDDRVVYYSPFVYGMDWLVHILP